MTLQPLLPTLTEFDLDTLEHSLDHYGCSKVVPSIYRACDNTRWQCEWDDLDLIGAFRSRWLGRCVRQAQRARERWLREQIAERRKALA